MPVALAKLWGLSIINPLLFWVDFKDCLADVSVIEKGITRRERDTLYTSSSFKRFIAFYSHSHFLRGNPTFPGFIMTVAIGKE